MDSPVFLQSRYVVPISRDVVRDGIVEIRGNRIAAIHPPTQKPRLPKDGFVDLGDRILIPGLVNAHCHLDYTSMAGMIPPPSSFTGWIHAIQGAKCEWTVEDFKQSWRRGAGMLLKSGVTTVCDIESVWDLVPEIARSTPLRVISCLEFISLSKDGEAKPLLQKLAQLQKLETPHRWTAALSPHAPYSTTPLLLENLSKALDSANTIVAMHVAESMEEWDMFKNQSGLMHEWLAPQRTPGAAAGKSPVQTVSESGLLSRSFLGIHMNYMDDQDALTFARTGASIVHCPRSHAYFDHGEFPIPLARKHGIRICLGTDSLATVRSSKSTETKLCLFTEMREFFRKMPGMSPREILAMTTAAPAAALGLSGLVGTLDAGTFADLVLIDIEEPTADPYEAILLNDTPPAGVMIDGSWVTRPSDLIS